VLLVPLVGRCDWDENRSCNPQLNLKHYGYYLSYACCKSRSTTVGMPSRRIFPLPLGLSTPKMACGKYYLDVIRIRYVSCISQVLVKFLYGHTIHACRTFVRHYLAIRSHYISSVQYLFNHPVLFTTSTLFRL